MKNKLIWIAVALFVVGAGLGGAWLALQQPAPQHEMVRQTDPDGSVYYTCAMHPQVRRAEPGNCPVCGMKLVEREDPRPGAVAAGERDVLYWYDPMRPDVHFEAPGKSPFMDMELVPKYAGERGGTVVEIDPRMAQNLGVRTAPVTRGAFWRRVDATARLQEDEYSIQAITVRASGWIERLHVRAEGDRVAKGQLVAEVYAPAIDTAQRELKLALELDDPGLIEAARARLVALGVDRAQIAALEGPGEAPRKVRIYAPRQGYVSALAVREGAAVQPDSTIMKIVSHDQIWAIAEVPEAQSSWLRIGRPIEVKVPALPGRSFEGTIDYLYPDLEQTTRTRRVRAVLDNPEELLHPGMYAQMTLYGGARRGVLLAPAEAVIRTGRRNVVIVAEGAGRFRPVEVEIGPEDDEHIVILAGLDEGQPVVTSGQFLIDSEASLLGAYARLDSDPPAGRMRQLGEEGHPAPYGSHSNRPAKRESQ